MNSTSLISNPGQVYLAKGDLVWIPTEQIPGKDNKERRMCLVLWMAETNTYAVCPITCSSHREHVIKLEMRDLESGRINAYSPSFIRPNLVHTLEIKSDWEKAGCIQEQKMNEVMNKVTYFINQPKEQQPVKPALERSKKRIR